MSLQFPCPDGGDFHVCAERAQFVGCCTADPCSMTGCSAGNLRPAHFPSDQYATFPDQQCDDGSFYTCKASGFMGCCRATPCDTIQTSQTTQIIGTTTTSQTFTSPALESSTTPQAPIRKDPLNVGAVVGDVVEGFFVLALLIVMLLWLRQRRSQDQVDTSAPSMPAPIAEQRLEAIDQQKQTHNDNPSSGISEPQSSPRSPPPPEYLSHTWSGQRHHLQVRESSGVNNLLLYFSNMLKRGADLFPCIYRATSLLGYQ
ncbi:uncharacterized protein E2P81_ATG10146 [Venturia nashicola]|nr:uncharacterized protein E2P81_ATG10146 [Venturia nashicola]